MVLALEMLQCLKNAGFLLSAAMINDPDIGPLCVKYPTPSAFPVERFGVTLPTRCEATRTDRRRCVIATLLPG